MSWARLAVGGLVVAAALGPVSATGQALRLGQAAPDITGERWINSVPLAMQALRGRGDGAHDPPAARRGGVSHP